MSSVCISSCVNDTRVPTRVVRATYVNLYKWPESDAEFVRSLSFRSSSSSSTASGHHHHHHQHLPHPKVVDSISCRQLYLRSYTFTRKESVNEKTKKCIGRVKEKVTNINGSSCKSKKKNGKDNEKGERGGGFRNKLVKEVPCAALKSLFRSLLFCSASVDVVEGE